MGGGASGLTLHAIPPPFPYRLIAKKLTCRWRVPAAVRRTRPGRRLGSSLPTLKALSVRPIVIEWQDSIGSHEVQIMALGINCLEDEYVVKIRCEKSR